MSGTHLAVSATSLRACYAKPGTDIPRSTVTEGPASLSRALAGRMPVSALTSPTPCPVLNSVCSYQCRAVLPTSLPPSSLRACYAMSGTEVAYGATQGGTRVPLATGVQDKQVCSAQPGTTKSQSPYHCPTTSPLLSYELTTTSYDPATKSPRPLYTAATKASLSSYDASTKSPLPPYDPASKSLKALSYGTV
eukprot:3935714-Rhodomonas_salina.4